MPLTSNPSLREQLQALADALRQPQTEPEPMDINDLPPAKTRPPRQPKPKKAEPEFLPTPRKMNDEETM